MANVDCNACGNLRDNAPDFVQNGVTNTICNSLKNDTGLNPNLKVTHTNCEDLDDANDCLVGMMDEQVEAYDVCDWKEFMHKFIPNLHAVIKAEICSMCGEWVNIHKHECQIAGLYNGQSFRIGENPDSSADAYAVAGKGVSFIASSGSDAHASDLQLMYIAGGLGRGIGSYRFYNDDFTEKGNTQVVNFDNGSTQRTSSARKGNDFWGTSVVDRSFPSGGELICEFRIKRSAFPQIKTLYSGFGIESGGGCYHVQFVVFAAGAYAYGQHGWCEEDGTQSPGTDYDKGHLVPDGWAYLQLRMSSCVRMSANGNQYSPKYFFGIRMNRDEVEC